MVAADNVVTFIITKTTVMILTITNNKRIITRKQKQVMVMIIP